MDNGASRCITHLCVPLLVRAVTVATGAKDSTELEYRLIPVSTFRLVQPFA
jgi:hypothetical protein